MDEITIMLSQIQEILVKTQSSLDETLKNGDGIIEDISHRIRADVRIREEEIKGELNRIIKTRKPNAEKTKEYNTLVESELNRLGQVAETELEMVSRNYKAKVKEEHEALKKFFEKFSAFYLEAQAKVAAIVEKNKTKPTVMLQQLQGQLEPMKKQFELMKSEITKANNVTADKIKVMNAKLENKTDIVLRENNKRYDGVLQQLRNLHKAK